jgi:hypothetical protein
MKQLLIQLAQAAATYSSMQLIVTCYSMYLLVHKLVHQLVQAVAMYSSMQPVQSIVTCYSV